MRVLIIDDRGKARSLRLRLPARAFWALVFLWLGLGGLGGALGLWSLVRLAAVSRELREAREALAKVDSVEALLVELQRERGKIAWMLGVGQGEPSPPEVKLSLGGGWPVVGEITRGFSRGHPGVDIAADPGAPVVCPREGVVAEIRRDKKLGLVLVINHEGDCTTLYGHISEPLVGVGDTVKAGQVIAKVAKEGGLSTGPHLHFQVIRDGKPIDPIKFINEK